MVVAMETDRTDLQCFYRTNELRLTLSAMRIFPHLVHLVLIVLDVVIVLVFLTPSVLIFSRLYLLSFLIVLLSCSS